MTQERRYLTPAEAADELRVSTDTILRLIGSGELPAIRVSPRVIRIPVPAFRRFQEGPPVTPRRVVRRGSLSERSLGADEHVRDGEHA
jgi:excisionase family DNA binding protein